MRIKTLKSIFYYMIVLIILGVTLFPLVWAIFSSFKDPLELISLQPSFIFKPTLDNYKNLLTGGSFNISKYFFNSIIVSVVSTVLSVAIACAAGYSLARIKPKGANVIIIGILAVRMLPPIVLIVPLYIFFSYIGLLDNLITLIIPYTALSVPLATWLLWSFFKGLPKQLEEAAMIDGCSRFRAFWQVMLPLAGPGVAATAIFSFVLAWNDFLLALPLTRVNAVTLPIFAAMVRTEEGVLWGKLGAAMTILIIPVFIFVLFAQRYIIAGLVSGAVKE